MARFDDLVADFLNVGAIRGGFGASILDVTATISGAGSPVALKVFAPSITPPSGTAFRIIGGGLVANNANAKSIRLAFGPGLSDIADIAPAINTANIWLFDVLAFRQGTNTVFVGKAYTGPQNGAFTATALILLNAVGGFYATTQGYTFLATQVAAGDITQNFLYITPAIIPS